MDIRFTEEQDFCTHQCPHRFHAHCSVCGIYLARYQSSGGELGRRPGQDPWFYSCDCRVCDATLCTTCSLPHKRPADAGRWTNVAAPVHHDDNADGVDHGGFSLATTPWANCVTACRLVELMSSPPPRPAACSLMGGPRIQLPLCVIRGIVLPFLSAVRTWVPNVNKICIGRPPFESWRTLFAIPHTAAHANVTCPQSSSSPPLTSTAGRDRAAAPGPVVTELPQGRS